MASRRAIPSRSQKDRIPMHHVFVSYVEEDEPIVLEIAEGLESVGYRTWYYLRDCLPGVSYLIQTGQAIEESQAVVVIVSPKSLSSHQVTKEVVRAHEAGKPFIPVLRGLKFPEFQRRQPEWREAMGGATSVRVPPAGVRAVLPQIVAGLKGLGLRPVDGDGSHRGTSSEGAAAGEERILSNARPTGINAAGKLWRLAVPILLVAALVAGAIYYRSRRVKPLTDKDTIVIADFSNSTGDPVFDDTLKTALSVSLDQSPFLSMLPDSKVADTLKLMTRPPDSKLTPDVARELCQRAHARAYIGGSIASLGSQYVLGLKVVSCQSGDTLAQIQATAAAKEQVLDTLGKAASRLRSKLGESLASVRKFDVPLEEATTSSLEALKAFSLGEKGESDADALRYHQRAIELDPNFAEGYLAVGIDYYNLGETVRASEHITKAFQLREHVSEWEKLSIAAEYYSRVTGELDKAAQTYQEWIATYPRDSGPHNNLGSVYDKQGQYEKAVEQYREGLRFTPDSRILHGNLALSLLALQRFDEARQIIQQAQARKLDREHLHIALYALGFLGSDPSAMAEQQNWYADHPDQDDFWLSLASQTEAYAGRLVKARNLSKRYVESAVHASLQEQGAGEFGLAALREAAFGDAKEARQDAEEGLKLAPASEQVKIDAALAYAMIGDIERTESMAQDLNRHFRLDTQMQSLWLPTIQGQLALVLKNPALALTALQAAAQIELGNTGVDDSTSCLYPPYVRGEAYLAAGQGKAAAAEFQKILDHSGIVWNCWTGALARLGVAQANALQAKMSQGTDADGARARALAAYKDFLTLWQDADPDIPIYRQAKAEYAKLQ